MNSTRRENQKGVKMRGSNWHYKESEELNKVAQGRFITSCQIKPMVLHIHCSDGDTLGIMYDNYVSWGLLLDSEEKERVCQIQKEKQRLADAVKLLIANFVHRTNITVDNVCVQHTPSPSKIAEQYTIDVNVSL